MWCRRRKYQNAAIAKSITNRGTATPTPILAPNERPELELLFVADMTPDSALVGIELVVVARLLGSTDVEEGARDVVDWMIADTPLDTATKRFANGTRPSDELGLNGTPML